VVAGPNDIVIEVTSQDGNSSTPYVIHVTRTKDSNNYLSSLVVTGYDLNEEFVKTTQDYTLTVNTSVESLTITATPEVQTSTVTGLTNVELVNDETVIEYVVTSEEGIDRKYTITVTKDDGIELITSFEYGHLIEDGMIKTVAYRTKPEQLKDQLDNENYKLQIKDKDETAIVEEETDLGTGMIVRLVVNEVEKDRKTIVVKGDVNGDGEIALLDAVIVLNHYLEKTFLTGVFLEAADTNSDGDIGLLDAVNILKIYLEN